MNKSVVIVALLVLVGGSLWYFSQTETVPVDVDNGDVTYSHEYIQVDSPVPNTSVSSPLTVSGQARGMWFFEADFPVRIFDDNNNELGVGIATAQEDWMTEDFVPFTAEIEFTESSTPTGLIVFERDNASGLPEHDDSFSFPVQFTSYQNGDDAVSEQAVELYFYNESLDTDASGNIQCSPESVVASERTIPRTQSPARDVVELVLAGDITDEESAAGLSTEYPLSGVSLEDIALSDGVLTIELNDPEFSTSGGSCRVTILSTQLTKTVLQFDTVDEVVYLPEDVFQP